MRILFYVLFVVLFSGLAILAQADDRITRIEQAWNSGSQEGMQADFSRSLGAARSSAELANSMAGKLEIKQAKRILPQTYGARVLVNGQEFVWVLVECENEPEKWCWFGARPASIIGGAEKGQLMDIGTTAVGLGLGFVEGNPIGIGPLLALKAALLAGSRYGDYEQCITLRPGLQTIGYGAGTANILTMIGAPIGISFVGMLATILATWDGAKETAMFECTEFALGG